MKALILVLTVLALTTSTNLYACDSPGCTGGRQINQFDEIACNDAGCGNGRQIG